MKLFYRKSDTIINVPIASDQEALEQIIHKKVDLKNAIIKDADLSNFKFSNLNLKNLVFVNCKLTNATFANNKMGKSLFVFSNANGSKFIDNDMVGAKFRLNKLIMSNFSGNNLEQSVLDKNDIGLSKISNCNFKNAIINNNKMVECTLNQIDFSQVKMLRRIDFSDSIIKNCMWAPADGLIRNQLKKAIIKGLIKPIDVKIWQKLNQKEALDLLVGVPDVQNYKSAKSFSTTKNLSLER